MEDATKPGLQQGAGQARSFLSLAEKHDLVVAGALETLDRIVHNSAFLENDFAELMG